MSLYLQVNDDPKCFTRTTVKIDPTELAILLGSCEEEPLPETVKYSESAFLEDEHGENE